MSQRSPSRAVRLIPNFNMTEPWSVATTPEEQEAMASSALLGGAADTDRSITTLLSQFANNYVDNLRQAGR